MLRPFSSQRLAICLKTCRNHQRRTFSRVASKASSSPSDTQSQRPRTIFSGIQPTGIPHLGNYLGALRNWVDLQESASPQDDLIFSVVGLHALTMPQDPKTLLNQRTDLMAALLAIGLDPDRCTIFHQDEVPEHAELGWILNCITPFGKLNRMTTWKSKLADARHQGSLQDVDENKLSLGLFAYPVLQAADILLYKATHVPVGEDQVQHLELSRDLADLFNRTFSKKKRFFPLPQHMITQTKRVLSLSNPLQKMSKSSPDANSRILLTDSDSAISSKIKRSVTDSTRELSFSPSERPGISNLLLILSSLSNSAQAQAQAQVQSQGSDSMGIQALASNRESPQEIADRLNRESGGGGSRVLKEALTEKLQLELRPIRERIELFKKERGYLEELERKGREKARERARVNLEGVKRLVGLMR